MTDIDNHQQAGRGNRVGAAVLLATASRDESSPSPVRLHCLAALDALAVPGAWTDRHSVGVRVGGWAGVGAETTITSALHLLGQLPLHEFGQPDVLAAARHARRALRELR